MGWFTPRKQWNPLYSIAGFFFAILLYVGYEGMFLLRAETAMGTVTEVRGVNGSCGGRRTRHNCTRYHAMVEFPTRGGSRQIASVDLEKDTSGYNQSPDLSGVRAGQPLKVYYNPRDPAEAHIVTQTFKWMVFGLIASVIFAAWFWRRVQAYMADKQVG